MDRAIKAWDAVRPPAPPSRQRPLCPRLVRDGSSRLVEICFRPRHAVLWAPSAHLPRALRLGDLALRTNRTRRVLHPVLIGHAAPLTPNAHQMAWHLASCRPRFAEERASLQRTFSHPATPLNARPRRPTQVTHVRVRGRALLSASDDGGCRLWRPAHFLAPDDPEQAAETRVLDGTGGGVRALHAEGEPPPHPPLPTVAPTRVPTVHSLPPSLAHL